MEPWAQQLHRAVLRSGTRGGEGRGEREGGGGTVGGESQKWQLRRMGGHGHMTPLHCGVSQRAAEYAHSKRDVSVAAQGGAENSEAVQSGVKSAPITTPA